MGYCTCKGTCKLPKFKSEYKTTRINRNAFRKGFFRCSECEYYIKELNYCPCCGLRLKKSPRNARSKRLLNNEVVRY